MCGEKSYTVAFVILYAGSPPRVRGKVMAFSSSDSAFRITPACAGKSKILSSFPKQSWDHPRVCGEKWAAKYKNECNLGSPPRVRGKGEHRQTGDGRRGDHPRVCGEKMFSISGDVKYPGSPPRVRGKDSPENKDISGRGITPACAGKSQLQHVGHTQAGDHPRVCGEKPALMSPRETTVGSPPRVRGKVTSCPGQLPVFRITPACAGKSFSACSKSCLCWDHPRVCGEKTKKIP